MCIVYMCMNNNTMQETSWFSSNDLTEEQEAAARNMIKPTRKDPGSSIVDSISSSVGGDGGGLRSIKCPSCGHKIELYDQTMINDLPGLPAGVKFDPTDQEILEHLEAKVVGDVHKIHPLIDEFIPTLDGENGICSTHPENLPGVLKDGQMRHFFHRPSKAYTTGTRKRRKVHTDDRDGSETRWHKTGKTRPIVVSGSIKGFKKILVLYINYGRQRKPEKTNWIMHQYHLGNNEEEKDGEFALSKVFYQTQPRQCGTSSTNIITTKDCSPNGEIIIHQKQNSQEEDDDDSNDFDHHQLVEYFNNPAVNFISYRASQQQSIPNIAVHRDDGLGLIRFAADSPPRKIGRKN